jgi:hypothetical protein
MLSLGIIAASLALTVYASLLFADKIHKRMIEDERWEPPARPTRASIVEKRRVLERDRKEWVETLNNHGETGATLAIEQIDKRLLALADEEARIQE